MGHNLFSHILGMSVQNHHTIVVLIHGMQPFCLVAAFLSPLGKPANLGWVLGTLIFYSINWSGDMFASANGNLHLWLVVWNMNGLFFHSVGNFIIPTDFKSIIFQRGCEKPPTSGKWWIWCDLIHKQWVFLRDLMDEHLMSGIKPPTRSEIDYLSGIPTTTIIPLISQYYPYKTR